MTSASSRVPPALSPFDPIEEFHTPFISGVPFGMQTDKPTESKGKAKDGARKPATTTPVYSYSGYKEKKVRVLYPNDQTVEYKLDYSTRDWYDHAKFCWPEIKDAIEVPVEHCQFTYDTPKFNPCVYTATKDYMNGRWGVSLHDSDRAWLASHPLSTDDGVPQADFMTCVHELVSVYDFAVDRVRVKAGSLLLGDHPMQWMLALGCNPFALVDHKTTNAEAAEKMGMTLEEANEMWRFEFHTEPLPGSIVGEKGWSNGNGVKTGYAGGHARYSAPRERGFGNWFGCIQLKRKNEVQYYHAPPSVEYIPRKGEAKLQISKITDPHGALIAIPRSGSTTAWDPVSPLIPSSPDSIGSKVGQAAVQAASLTPSSSAVTTKDDGPYQDGMDGDLNLFTKATAGSSTKGSSAVAPEADPFDKNIDNYCPFCTTAEKVEEMLYGGVICKSCHDELWSMGLTCNKCEQQFNSELYPEPIAYDAKTDSAEWRCPTCKESLFVPLDNLSDQQGVFETLTTLSCLVFMDQISSGRDEQEKVSRADFDLSSQW